MSTYKLISWNVNGLRSALKKGFREFVESEKPDAICLQETKAQQNQVTVDLKEYEEYWNSAEKKGYSGTAIFTRNQPLQIMLGMHINPEISLVDDQGRDAAKEGRVLTAEFPEFYLVTVYTPNSKGDLSRLDFRASKWDPYFLGYVKELEKTKPVAFCGDLNVAHTELDLARPKDNEGEHGFTKEERAGFDRILSAGFVDTFRMFEQEGNHYTWWTPWRNARQRNIGWRIDYFCVSAGLKDNVVSAGIMPQILGSDHCPVYLNLKFS